MNQNQGTYYQPRLQLIIKKRMTICERNAGMSNWSAESPIRTLG